jgi:hypothetical protein
MSMPLDKRNEFKRRMAQYKNVTDPVQKKKEAKFLQGCIAELLEDSAACNHQFKVIDVPHSGGRQELYALTKEMADLFCAMCRIGSTVTWKAMQNTSMLSQPGGGFYMLSEPHSDDYNNFNHDQPKALPKEKPDGPEQHV